MNQSQVMIQKSEGFFHSLSFILHCLQLLWKANDRKWVGIISYAWVSWSFTHHKATKLWYLILITPFTFFLVCRLFGVCLKCVSLSDDIKWYLKNKFIENAARILIFYKQELQEFWANLFYFLFIIFLIWVFLVMSGRMSFV